VPKEPARWAYEAYGVSRNWRTYDDRPMPSWDELGNQGDTGEAVRDAWRAAAQAAVVGSDPGHIGDGSSGVRF